jgi:hypothetical protein
MLLAAKQHGLSFLWDNPCFADANSVLLLLAGFSGFANPAGEGVLNARLSFSGDRIAERKSDGAKQQQSDERTGHNVYSQ